MSIGGAFRPSLMILGAVFFTFHAEAQLEESDGYCNITFQIQPPLGSLAKPNSTSAASGLQTNWLDPAFGNGTLGTLVSGLIPEAETYFSKLSLHPSGLLSWHDLIKFRVQHIPILKAFFDRTQLIDLDRQFSGEESKMVYFFDSIHRELLQKAESLRIPRDQYLLPSAFVNKVNPSGEQVLTTWNFRITGNPFFDRYRLTHAYSAKQIPFELWAKIISVYGILPVSAFNNLSIHDIFGHTFAALVHPYEELFLQRQFYHHFTRESALQTGEQKAIYSNMYSNIANILFESLEIPKSNALAQVRSWGEKSRQELRPFYDHENQMLDAEKLIAHFPKLSNHLIGTLLEFRSKIILPDDAYYSSGDYFGGDFYDTLNHFKMKEGIRNFSDPSYGFSLEHLRIRSLAQAEKINPELARLFTAYVNAAHLKLKFQDFYDAALSSDRVRGVQNIPIPWQDTPIEQYLKSYTKPAFRAFLDEVFAGQSLPLP